MTIAAQLRVAIALLIALLAGDPPGCLLRARAAAAQREREVRRGRDPAAVLRPGPRAADRAPAGCRRGLPTDARARTARALLRRGRRSNADLTRMKPLLRQPPADVRARPHGDDPDLRAPGRPRPADRRRSVRARPRRGGTACRPRSPTVLVDREQDDRRDGRRSSPTPSASSATGIDSCSSCSPRSA